MTGRIHPTAVVEGDVRLSEGVVVGPFCRVSGDVALGAGTELLAYASVLGPARVGQRNRIHEQAVLGGTPQDRSFAGEASLLEVGDDNVFREQVTVHRGTNKGGGVTRIGSRGLFMVGAHVAHDAQVGDDVTLANLTTLGGHVIVERGVVCAGHVAVAPFVRLGRSSFLAGGAKVERDVPPFVIAAGDRARVRTLNRVGLERAGISEASRRALRRAFRLLYRSGLTRSEALIRLRVELPDDPCVRELASFLSLERDLP